MYASSSSQVAKTFRRSIHLHRLRSTKGFKLSFKLLLLDKNSYWARILKNSATMVSHQKYRIFFEFQFCVFLTNFSQNISQLVHYGKRTDDPFRKHILCLLWRNMSFILEVKLIITICDALCFTNFIIEFTHNDFIFGWKKKSYSMIFLVRKTNK